MVAYGDEWTTLCAAIHHGIEFNIHDVFEVDIWGIIIGGHL